MNFRNLLFPFALIYSAASRIRNILFDTGILKQQKFNVPIIVIGNLSTGGTGKTPHVEYVVSLLRLKHKIAILSRGYGRTSKGFIIAGKDATASLIGDEPMQYYLKFKDVTVCVCEDRIEGINKLLVLPDAPSVIIMDDGFQHRYVNAGFKILLSSYHKLFTKDFLLPAGNLREPRAGYKRADCIIVTKSPADITDTQKNNIKSEVNITQNQEMFFSHLMYENLIPVFSGDEIKLEELKLYYIFLVTGIADPLPLHQMLKKEVAGITTHFFNDHHIFSKADMVMLNKKMNTIDHSKKLMIITEKDYVRLKYTGELQILKDLPVYYIPVSLKINEEEKLNKILETYVEENKRHSRLHPE